MLLLHIADWGRFYKLLIHWLEPPSWNRAIPTYGLATASPYIIHYASCQHDQCRSGSPQLYYYPVCICTGGLLFGCVCLCMCHVAKKRTVWGFTTWKFPISVIYCSLVEYNCQKCQVIHSGIEIRKHSINGTREWLWKTVFWFKKHALSTYNAATCMQLVLANAEQQHATAVQTYNIATGTVCTDSA